jgi:hypothetical protein
VLVAGVGDAPLAARAADMLRGDAIDIIPVVAEGNGSAWSSTSPRRGADGSRRLSDDPLGRP